MGQCVEDRLATSRPFGKIQMMSGMKSFFDLLLSPWTRLTVGNTNASTRDEWVEDARNIPAGVKILDAGAGECQYRHHCRHLKYVSQDFSKYDGLGNNSSSECQLGSVKSIDIVWISWRFRFRMVSSTRFCALKCLNISLTRNSLSRIFTNSQPWRQVNFDRAIR